MNKNQLVLLTVIMMSSLMSCSKKFKNSNLNSSVQNEKTELIAWGSYPDYYYSLANELNNSGRTAKAIEAYQNCIQESKSQTFVEDAMYNLSMLYFERGDDRLAYTLMDSLLSLKYTWLPWYKNAEHAAFEHPAYQLRLAKIDSIIDLKDDHANCHFHYQDVANFIKAFDKSQLNWSESPAYFYNDYFAKASKGLYFYQRFKIQSSAHQFAYRVEDKRKYFESIRSNLETLHTQEAVIRSYLNKFEELYLPATFPDIYYTVGCFNAGGTSSPFGLLIGAEMHTKKQDSDLTNFNNWEKAVVRDFSNLPLITIHELVHIQQNNDYSDLLGNAIYEGAADFISELICGSHINKYVHDWVDENGKEQAVWDEFKSEMFANNSRNWIGNADRAKDKPADLGYYIGFKICESYYNKQSDKKSAINDIITINDWNDFYEKSGYMQ